MANKYISPDFTECSQHKTTINLFLLWILNGQHLFLYINCKTLIIALGYIVTKLVVVLFVVMNKLCEIYVGICETL